VNWNITCRSAWLPTQAFEGNVPLMTAVSPLISFTGTLKGVAGNFQYPAASKIAPINTPTTPGSQRLTMRRLYITTIQHECDST
jgi:hypothetical protein